MIFRSLFSLALLTSCSSPAGQRGDVGPPGSDGTQGPRGDTGPAGPPGATGSCNMMSCPQITSVDGLSGGSISGTITVSSLNVSGNVTVDTGSSPLPRGIVVVRGGVQTSLNGYYCGKTSFLLDGFLGDAARTVPPNAIFDELRMAKNHCEVTCGDSAAHPCLSTEVMQWISLGGGSNSYTNNAPNPAVPMPPTGAYWVMPPDGNAECTTWGLAGASGSTTLTGITYSSGFNEGRFAKETCEKTHALLCCL